MDTLPPGWQKHIPCKGWGTGLSRNEQVPDKVSGLHTTAAGPGEPGTAG